MARYNSKVDIWALGCVYGEMMIGCPLFPGTRLHASNPKDRKNGALIADGAIDPSPCLSPKLLVSAGKNNMDQFLCIVMQLGTPSAESLAALGQDANYSMVRRTAKSWEDIGLKASDDELSLLSAMLQYTPSTRPSADDILQFPALQNCSTSSNTASACSTPLLPQEVPVSV